MRNKSKKTIDCGVIDRKWEYSSEPRLEGLLKASKYLKWKNINDTNKKEELK